MNLQAITSARSLEQYSEINDEYVPSVSIYNGINHINRILHISDHYSMMIGECFRLSAINLLSWFVAVTLVVGYGLLFNAIICVLGLGLGLCGLGLAVCPGKDRCLSDTLFESLVVVKCNLHL